MGDAVADEHVELVLVVLDGEDHGHGLSDLDDPAHFARPRALAHLDLHPALEVITQEVGRHGVEHVHGERPERDRFLIIVVPLMGKKEKKRRSSL